MPLPNGLTMIGIEKPASHLSHWASSVGPGHGAFLCFDLLPFRAVGYKWARGLILLARFSVSSFSDTIPNEYCSILDQFKHLSGCQARSHPKKIFIIDPKTKLSITSRRVVVMEKTA